MLTTNLLYTTNEIFCDPLGQFEVLNIFSTARVQQNTHESHTLLAGLFKWLKHSILYSAEFLINSNLNKQTFTFIQDCGNFFSAFIKFQIHIFTYNMLCGLDLLPFLLLEPNSVFLNFIDDSFYNILVQTYTLPRNRFDPILNEQLVLCFETLNSVLPTKYTPLTFALVNNLTFQDFFFNFFIHELYLSQILLTAQITTFNTINIFGALYDQHMGQTPYLTNLNSILNPHNTSILYKYPELSENNKNAIYLDGLNIFNKLFGLSITDISNIIFNNKNINNNIQELTEQELAFYIGFKIFIEFANETEIGIERLWNNFGSLYNITHPCVFTGSCLVNEFDPFASDFVYNIGTKENIDSLCYRLITTYYIDFWPAALRETKKEIIENSTNLIATLLKEQADISLPSIIDAVKSDDDQLILNKMKDMAETLRLTQVSEYYQVIFKLDKLYTIQIHTYKNAAILNPALLPYVFENCSKQQHNYNIWCYFQLKNNDATIFKTNNYYMNYNPLDLTSDFSYKPEPLNTAQKFASNLSEYALDLAKLVCVDIKPKTSNNSLILDDTIEYINLNYELDFSKVAELQEILNKNKWVQFLIEDAFKRCLDTLEPFYLNAATPVSAYHFTEILLNFMAYLVRGVILNPNPEMFCQLLPYSTHESISNYQPIFVYLNYFLELDSILQPLMVAFNIDYFGYAHFTTTQELLIFLLAPENEVTLHDFAGTYGISLLIEFLICAKNLWIFAHATGTEFKLDNALQPTSVLTDRNEARWTSSLASMLTYYLNLDIVEEDRRLIGPFSFFSTIAQQLPKLGITNEQMSYVHLKHIKEVGCYEQFFNIYSDTFRTAYAREFIEARFAAIKGEVLARDADDLSFDAFLFKMAKNKFHYLSDVPANLIFFSVSPIFDEFLFSIFLGFLLDNQSVLIAFIILIMSIIFFIMPIITNIKLIPLNWQYVMENIYKFILNILNAQVGKVAMNFFPYVFSIFCIILIANLAGMTLYAFTLTSHILVTFTLGVSSFLGLTILGFYIQKLAFFNLFLPKGIPAALIPILLVVEIISYVSRALSLSIRLFANLMSGHTLLHILAFFSSKLFKYKYIIGLLSFLLILAIVVLEFCIAILQAYVFAILICIYLNDSFNGGH